MLLNITYVDAVADCMDELIVFDIRQAPQLLSEKCTLRKDLRSLISCLES